MKRIFNESSRPCCWLAGLFYICNMVALSKFFRRVSLDMVGFSASTICAIHCLLFPALVLAGSLSAATVVHNHLFENIVLAVSGIVGILSLLPAYYSHHRSLRPLMLFSTGMLLIVSSRLTGELTLHTVLTTFGAVLIAWSHLQNWRRSHAAHPSSKKARDRKTDIS